MKQHRWSGWPGAICLDCGIEDPCEQCIADSSAERPCYCIEGMDEPGHVQTQPCRVAPSPCLAKERRP